MSYIRHLTFTVTGMTCSNCALGIELSLSGVDGIISATINPATDDLEVVFNLEIITAKEIVICIRKTGYDIVASKVETGIMGLQDETDALNLEHLLLRQEGVVSAAVSYNSGMARFEFIPGANTLSNITHAIRKAGFEIPSTPGQTNEYQSLTDISEKKRGSSLARMITGLVLTLPLVVFSMLRDFGLAGFTHDLWAMFAVATMVQFYVGGDFYFGAWRSLRLGRANMDVLIVLGSSVAWLSSSLVVLGLIPGKSVFFETGAVIIAFIRLGKYLESHARGKTTEALKGLIALQERTATLLDGRTEKSVPVEEIKFGDKVIIRPGERIPVDGVICSGSTSVDESTLTGESMPVSKGPGGALLSGTINLDGSVVFEVTKVGKDSTLAQMIRLVREAQLSKPPIQELTDEIGKYFVPLIIALALFTFTGWVYVGGVGWQDAMINAIAVLVIACPCAIGLATPTAIVVGLARGAGLGILFRSGEALEKTGKADIVVLDKTGTITTGKPAVSEVIPFGVLSAEELLSMAASAETGSEHPIGKAIAGEGKMRGLAVEHPDDFKSFSGFGIRATVSNLTVTVGSPAMLTKLGVDLGKWDDRIDEFRSMGRTVVIVATAASFNRNDLVPVGLITVADHVKPGAAQAVEELKKLGTEVVMITGDNAITANSVAAEVGITRVIADVPPGGKVDAIKRMQQTGIKSGISQPVVAMVGDGINDAPALAAADAGIAIGSGSDIAVAAAGVTLPGGDISAVAKAISLSRGTSETVVQNLIWALFYNVALIPVAAFGLLSPMFAAGAMALSSIFVVANSLKLKEYKIRSFEPPKSLARRTLELIPRLALPTISLAGLITFPMLAMSQSEMEIKNTLETGMEPLLMMVMAISNGLIAISYSSIPVFLVVFVRKRKDLPFSWILVLFGLFILACGATHVVHILGLWWAVDWWQATIDASCAVISVGTAIVLWPYLPKLLAIPSPTQLREINAELQSEQEKLILIQKELQKAYDEVEKKVEERTAELMLTNRALQKEIQERRKAVESLHETNEYLENLFTYANAPIIVWDTSLRITRFNHAFENLSGYSRDEVIGRPLDFLFPPETAAESLDLIYKTSAGERWDSVEIEILRKDGDIRTVLWNSAFVLDSLGREITATIAQGNDITARKKAEDEVRALNIELEKRVRERTVQYEEANRELESFSYSVSHDLRAPLRGIDGFSLALLEEYQDVVDERGRMYLERVRFNAQKMGQLIDEMLNLSRVSRAPMNQKNVDLSEVAKGIIKELTEHEPEREVDVTITPGMKAVADPTLIGAVLQNLLSNAWKFTAKKKKSEIIFGQQVINGVSTFYVKDNGAGFNMEYSDKLFAPFQRLHRTDEFIGTGVGLTTVQRIIKRHSGKIWAEGVVGEGAIFYFTIHSEKGE